MNTDSLTAIAKTVVRRPPSEVYTAFCDGREMSKFWFTRQDRDLEADGTSTWSLGTGSDAMSFEVRVKELDHPNKIVIEWPGPDGKYTRVEWIFEETGDGDTILAVEESGFTGSDDAIVERALDSTGGFNQVVVAAKAMIEHGVELNVVADHA